ncbi:MAG: FG-GAP repeat protein [Planctomycetes bacterium]|nr:FG-GAP repeat protein [Planctomycetota bacterium]
MRANRIVLALVFGFAAWRGASAGIDVNGDSFDDVVVGIPDESIDGALNVGAILVIPGSATGLEPGAAQWITPKDIGIDPLGVQKRFGQRLAAGDFDGDGFDDVAVGCPGYAVTGKQSAGLVVVLRGGPAGLRTSGVKKWSQASPGIADKPDPDEFPKDSFENFGRDLVAADFDGDGRCDLAIGVAESFTPFHEKSGAVHVLFGSKKGLRSARSRFLHFDVKGVPGSLGVYDDPNGAHWTKFGTSLAATDVDGDGRSELVVGTKMPYDADTFDCAFVFKGTKKGLDLASAQIVPYDGDASSVHESVGTPTLFASDLDADGLGDLVFGCPEQSAADELGAGTIHVFRGTAAGIDPTTHVQIDRGLVAVDGLAVQGAQFGRACVTGDFDGDGVPEFVVGAPGDPIAMHPSSGSVHHFSTGPALVSTTGDFTITQEDPGIAGMAFDIEQFGLQLATGDHDGDGFEDLVIAVPGENVGAGGYAGALHRIRGSAMGLVTAGSQFLTQADLGVTDGPESGDRFGSVLAP